MVGTIAVADKGSGTVKHPTNALQGHFQRVTGNLRKGRFEPLSHRRGPNIDGECTIGLQYDARGLLGTRGAAFDEAANRKPVIAPTDLLAIELDLFPPADFLQAAVERDLVVAAVELVLVLVGRDG